LTPRNLAKKIAQFALSKKAFDVTIMDLRKITDMTDFFVICSADSDIQTKAIADAVAEGTEKLGIPPWHSEGLSQRRWVLLDFVDVVVHVFHKETRKFYGLEKLWGDAAVETVEDSPPGAAVRKKTARKPRSKSKK